MATSKSKKSNQKYIIISIALALSAIGYFGYRSMLTTPDINKVAPPVKSVPTPKPPKKTPTPTTKPSATKTPTYTSAPNATPRH